MVSDHVVHRGTEADQLEAAFVDSFRHNSSNGDLATNASGIGVYENKSAIVASTNGLRVARLQSAFAVPWQRSSRLLLRCQFVSPKYKNLCLCHSFQAKR